MKVQFEIKKLAKALASANKAPGNSRPTSYQDFLHFLSKAAGYATYEAYQAGLVNNASESTKEPSDLKPGFFTSVWDSGHTITTPCKVDFSTMRVCKIGLSDCQEDLGCLYDQYITVDEKTYRVIETSDNYSAMEEYVFAISCYDDLMRALSPVISLIEEAAIFGLGGFTSSYGLNGDVFQELENLFSSGEEFDLAEELDQITLWTFEGEYQFETFEAYYSVYQILFSKIVVDQNRTFIVIPTTSDEDSIRVMK